MAASGVQVVVRLRPLNEREKKHGTLPVISASTNDKTVTVIKGTGSHKARSSFAFDNVFTAFSTQEEVFDTTLKPVISDVLKGYESTVFAYGQTGTGKTHTMEGSLANPEEHGVIPRSAQAIFEQLTREELKYESFSVFCSYLEIYNEELCDLLAEEGSQKNVPHNQKLEIMEGKNGPFCRGLSEKQVESSADVLLLMQKAQHQKKVGETNMNKSSSRSHCIFTIRMNAKRRLDDGALFESKGKLHMVDLAGSECAKTANMEDGGHEQAARERERMNINRSLLTLGRVVKILKEQSTNKKKANVRIPYRDSKLTRILQQSLGGTCKTCIIATLSPSETAIEESISTLNYAQSAHGIINKPAVSTSYMSQATSSSAMLLGNDAAKGNNAGGTIEHWNEMECRLVYMTGQVEEAKAALARKHLQQQELVDRAEKAETEKVALEQQLQETENENGVLKEDLAKEKEERQTIEEQLADTKAQLERTVIVLRATQETESSLTSEAGALVEALKQSITDGDEMYQAILTSRENDIARRNAANEFNSVVVTLLGNVTQALTSLSGAETTHQTKITDMATTSSTDELQFVENTKEVIKSALECVNTAVSSLKECMNNETNGIIPTVDTMTNAIATHVGDTRSSIEAGERELTDKFASTKAMLAEFTSRLGELESSYNKSTEGAINALGTHVNKSKENVQNLINSTSSTLEKLRSDRQEIREATQIILGQWKSTSIEGSEAIQEQSRTQMNSVAEVLGTMKSEMQRHNKIETQLTDQLSLLQNGQAECVTKHEAQKSSLHAAQNKLNESHNKQNEALSTFVQNVMKGVEQLVQTQMAEIIKESNSTHTSILESSNALIESEANIAQSTLNTYRSAEVLSSNIQNEANFVKQNDASVMTHLGATKEAFSKVENLASSQQTNIETFAADAFGGLQKLADMEKGDVKALETLASEGQLCMDHLADQVLEQTRDQMIVLKESGDGVVRFAGESVLPSMNSAVADMEKPRSDMMNSFSNNVSKLENSAKDSSAVIKEKAALASKAGDDLEEGMSAVESDFLHKTVESRTNEIEKAQENLLQCIKDHADGTCKALKGTHGETTKTVSTVDCFVTNVLSADKEVEAAPDRIVVEYCKELSSTPPEEEIVKATMELPGKVTDTSLESDVCSMNSSEASNRSSLETVDSGDVCNNAAAGGYAGSVLKSISPNDEDSLKKRSRRNISTTPVKESPGRKAPQRRPSKLALPKVSSSIKRARR
jgi:kinesin family protein 11